MVDRRTFLKHAGSLASAALVLPPMQSRRRYKIGLELFTINRDMNRDPVASLQRVAQMGYEEVETYGLDPKALTYYGLPAVEFAKRLQGHNLVNPSGHYDLQQFLQGSTDDLHRYVDRCAEGARILGQRYIVWPYIEPRLRTLDTFKQVAGLLNVIGSRLAKTGLHVAYHNNGGEFIAQAGQVPYDVILRETDPGLVKLQIDLYWHAHDTSDPPHTLFTRAPGRFAMWHVKDMHKVSRDYTEMGNGTIDYTKIWPDAAMSGMEHFYVEQGGNFAVSAMQSAADGIAYVKKYLQK
jgi:sugar phosphate isomerase/epimerase